MGVSKNEFVLKLTDHYLAHCHAIFLFSQYIVTMSGPYQINMCAQGTRLISVNQIHIRPVSNLRRLLSSKNLWNVELI